MTAKVEIPYLKPDQVMDIVRELRKQGLVQGKDFDFAFHQAEYDLFSHEPPTPRYTVFTFYNDKHASFFALKYL